MQEAMGSSPITSTSLCATGWFMIGFFGVTGIFYQPQGADSGDLDIEIPPLDVMPFPDGMPTMGQAPIFSDLFEDEPIGSSGVSAADLKIKTFARFDKLTEEPKPYFKDPAYYQKLLSGEGDISKRVHQILQEFLKAEDPQDKSMYKQRLVPAYWELAGNIAGKIGSKLSDPKALLLRYGVLLPTAIDADQRQFIASLIWRSNCPEPVFYVDEWLKQVAHGRVNSSAVDETKAPQRNEAAKFNAIFEKTKGRYDAQIALVNTIAAEMHNWERMVVEHAENIAQHANSVDASGVVGPYNETQRTSFSEIGELLRKLSYSNRRLQQAHTELEGVREQLGGMQAKSEDGPEDTVVDTKMAVEEMGTIRQMAKMCVGRQGNHFPMLSKQYFRASIRDVGVRENVINIMADIEYLDAGLFLRTFKQQTNRIVPNIILIPCYGDVGICWEPFERFNRATSRGRMAIPMYPKDLRVAISSACADLRWQVAKEKAQHYWMEEGLTGWYYQWFSDNKMKGDVKDQFIADYILWLTREFDGTQKLEKPVREIFWRYMPFPQEVKDKLKLRGSVYAELCKKDLNRSMSDGY